MPVLAPLVSPYLPETLLELVACPMCKAPLHPGRDSLDCSTCGRTYPVDADGMPHLLPDALRNPGADRGWQFWSEMQGRFKKWVADDYNEEAPGEFALYREFADLYLRGGEVVVDVGGFWGMNREWTDPGALFVVIDPDDQEIRRPSLGWMRETFPFAGTPCPFLHGVGEYLPLKSESVDRIILEEVLDHFLHPETVLHECYRVLRPGGTLGILIGIEDGENAGLAHDIAVTYRRKGLYGLARGVAWKARSLLFPGENRHGHIHHFTRAKIEAMLEGFPERGFRRPETPGWPNIGFFWARKR